MATAQDLVAAAQVGSKSNAEAFDAPTKEANPSCCFCCCRHFCRGFLPKFAPDSYWTTPREKKIVQDMIARSSGSEGSTTSYAKRVVEVETPNKRSLLVYTSWRRSALYTAAFFALLGSAVVVGDYLRCEWTSTSVQAACDPLPEYFRGGAGGAMGKLREALYATSFITPGLYLLQTLFVLFAALLWKHIRISRRLLMIGFVLNFAAPFIVQIIPYSSFLDFDQIFEGVTSVYLEKDESQSGDAQFVSLISCKDARENVPNFDADDCFALQNACQWIQNPGSSDLPDAMSLNTARVLTNRYCEDMFGSNCDATTFAGTMTIDCTKAENIPKWYWQSFAGMIFAGFAFKSLFPAAMSLLPSLQLGGRMVKAMFPQTSLPGFLILLKPIIYVPMYAAFSLAFMQTTGDYVVLLAVVAMTLSQGAWLVVGRQVLNKMSWSQYGKRSLCVLCFKLLMQAASIGLLVLYMIEVEPILETLGRMGVPSVSYRFDGLELGAKIVTVMCNIMIARVMFADVVVGVCAKVYATELQTAKGHFWAPIALALKLTNGVAPKSGIELPLQKNPVGSPPEAL